MIFTESVKIGSVDDFVGRRIREIGIMLCQPNCSLVNCVCWVVDEVECFFCWLFCLCFCCHFDAERMRGSGVEELRNIDLQN